MQELEITATNFNNLLEEMQKAVSVVSMPLWAHRLAAYPNLTNLQVHICEYQDRDLNATHPACTVGTLSITYFIN
jgi:hypothetical protein